MRITVVAVPYVEIADDDDADFVPTHSTSSRNSVRKVANGWELRLDDGGRYMTNSIYVLLFILRESHKKMPAIVTIMVIDLVKSLKVYTLRGIVYFPLYAR